LSRPRSRQKKQAAAFFIKSLLSNLPLALAQLPHAEVRLAHNGFKWAGLIDARVKAIAKSGVDDVAVFTDLADCLPAFKRFMDTSTDDDMDQLAARYTGFYQYAQILSFGARVPSAA
jgi:hypothetical protein